MFKLYNRWALLGEHHLNAQFQRIHRALLLPTWLGLVCAFVYAATVLSGIPTTEAIPWAALAPAAKLLGVAVAWQILIVGALVGSFHIWSMVSPVARTMERIPEDPRFA